MAPFEPELLEGCEPVTETDVRGLEAEIGPLPADYRSFLLEMGGVELMVEAVIVAEKGEELRVAAFLGREDGELLEERDQVAEGFLPIARDPGDDLYCLVLPTGPIVRWAHDWPGIDPQDLGQMVADLDASGADTGHMNLHQIVMAWQKKQGIAPGPGALLHVADTFAEFVARMRPVDPDG